MSPAIAGLPNLLEPIPGPNPCGFLLDIDSEEDLLWLQETIEKTTTFGEGEIDWPGILERSTRLLAQRSKDWSLVCYTVRALHHLEGVAGLAAGLDFLRDTVQRYWADMHPALPSGLRKRVNLLEWLVTGLADDVGRQASAAADVEALRAVRERVAGLDDFLRERLGPSYPGVRVLRDALSRREELAQPPDPAVAVAPLRESATEAAAGAAAAPAEFPPPIADADAADRVLGKCREGMFAACDALQAADPAEARSYRVRRIAAWMNYDRTPPAEEGRLALPGPDPEDGARLRAALDKDAAGVLAEAETRLQIHPLWLDLQHLACSALRRLGKEHQSAREGIEQETAGLLRRLPGLGDLRFANDVPVADETTRAWIEEALGAAPAERVAAAPAAAAGDRLAQSAAPARDMAGRGEIEQSLEVLGAGLRGAAGGRERFLWRLAAARHCAREGLGEMALDLLAGLDQEAAEQRLEEWEPELCAEVLRAALEAGKRAKGRRGAGPEALERMPQLARRMARFDLIAALRMAKER